MLIIASVNLGGSLLARAVDRHHELSVRMALGAGRERLIRRILTENVLSSRWVGARRRRPATAAIPGGARLVPVSLPIPRRASADVRLLGLGLGISVGTAVLGSGPPSGWQRRLLRSMA